jgi:E3 ubiquitin-protein ligase RGLG
LNIIIVGVGDGPFDLMQTFDNKLPKRKFDNCQFVDLNKVFDKAKANNVTVQVQFMIDAMQEIPDSYIILKKMGKLFIEKSANFNQQWEYVHPTKAKHTALEPSAPIISDESICAICLVNKANGVIIECGHTICFDGDCKNKITTCHICRKNITKIIKLYQ